MRTSSAVAITRPRTHQTIHVPGPDGARAPQPRRRPPCRSWSGRLASNAAAPGDRSRRSSGPQSIPKARGPGVPAQQPRPCASTAPRARRRLSSTLTRRARIQTRPASKPTQKHPNPHRRTSGPRASSHDLHVPAPDAGVTSELASSHGSRGTWRMPRDPSASGPVTRRRSSAMTRAPLTIRRSCGPHDPVRPAPRGHFTMIVPV